MVGYNHKSKHVDGIGEIGGLGLAPKKSLEATPTRTSEKALMQNRI